MQGAVELGLPEIQERPELRKMREQIELLPDESLDDVRVIRKVIEDFCGREAISFEPVMRLSRTGHGSLRLCSCTDAVSCRNKLGAARKCIAKIDGRGRDLYY